MEETFARRLADARRRGRLAVVWMWQRELAGLLVMGLRKAGRMEAIGLEVRYAARRLWRAPAFTCAAVATLALAIGANGAIFTLVHRIVLNPLPYPDDEQLIQLDHGSHRLNVGDGMGLTSGLYFHYAARAQTISGLALYRVAEQTLTGSGSPERLRTAHATPSLARVLGVNPIEGRWFSEAEGHPGAPRVALVSHALWMRRYGGDPALLGRALTLDGRLTAVVGVMPPSFQFPDPDTDVWIAEQLTPSSGFGLWSYRGVARLHRGRTIEEARAEFNALVNDVAAAYPQDPRAAGNVMSRLFFAGKTLKDATLGNVERGLWMLLAAVGLVLLVACANVGNLFLVRSEIRQREVAVRRALGAEGTGIARYFFTESALLSLMGGIIGLAIAWTAARLVVAFAPPNLPRVHEVRIDAVVVAFTAALSALAAILFGSIPLLRREDSSTMRDQSRSITASAQQHRARQLLMAAQVAVALVLLVGAGLMGRSFQALRAVDPGFDARSALTFTVGLPQWRYPTREAATAAHHDIIGQLSALPGVTAVSASTCLPLRSGCFGNTVRIEGRASDGGVPPLAMFRAVAGSYFSTMGIRIIRGRELDRSDIELMRRVVVVSAALANRFFPGENPLGRRIASNNAPSGSAQSFEWLEIVGVAADTPTAVALPAGAPAPQVFMPMSIAGGPGISPLALIGPDITVMSYVVRTTRTPMELAPELRAAVHAIDTDLPIAQMATLQQMLDRAASRMTFTTVLLAIAAAVAVVLGVIGIYGVMSYVVSRRTAEIGVRLALGAEPTRVAADVIREGSVVAGLGLVVGAMAALAAGTLMESLLYGVSPRDAAVFLSTAVALGLISLVACWLPARRAARLNPVEALPTGE